MKEQPKGSAPTAVAETPTAPKTSAELAATEQALGLTTTTTTDSKPAARPPVSVRMGVAPTTVDEAWRLSRFIANSELVPKAYRGRPEDVFVAIQFGLEVGLLPMQALNSIFVTNGRPTLWGDGLLAVVMASAVYKDHDEYFVVGGERREFLLGPDLAKDDTTAVATFWRKDNPRPRTASFSVAQAKKASLWSKQGPWQEYPDRMLKMRARSFAAHDTFPDVLRGVRSSEEVIDLPAQTTDAIREVRRVSESPAVDTPQPVTPQVVLPAATVTDLQSFLGGYTITLSDGTKVDTTDGAQALELEQFRGTEHQVRLTVAVVEDGTPTLISFTIAD